MSRLYCASFPAGEDRMLPREEYLEYLEQCANSWESIGHFEQANVIRCRILTVLHTPEETKDEIQDMRYHRTRTKVNHLLQKMQTLFAVASSEECPWPLLYDCVHHSASLLEQVREILDIIPMGILGFRDSVHEIIPLEQLEAAFQQPIPWNQLRKEKNQ